jgi:hypothetical protein
MSFVVRGQLTDGFRWKCRGCGGAVSLRTNSFFSQSHLSLQQLILIIYEWSRNYPQLDIAHEAGIPNSLKTIIDWCSFCRDICEQHLIENPEVIGGLHENGFSKVVESTRVSSSIGSTIGANGEKGIGYLVESKGDQEPDRTADTLSAIVRRCYSEKMLCFFFCLYL